MSSPAIARIEEARKLREAGATDDQIVAHFVAQEKAAHPQAQAASQAIEEVLSNVDRAEQSSQSPSPILLPQNNVLPNDLARYKGATPDYVKKAYFAHAGDFHRWAEGQNHYWPGCILYGDLATGKTSWSILALQRARECNKRVRFEILIDIVVSIKDAWAKATGEGHIVSDMREPDLLVIDEVGVQFGTDGERNICYEIVVGRHNARKPTILTTNCDLGTDTGRQEFYNSVGRRVARRFEGHIINTDLWKKYKEAA